MTSVGSVVEITENSRHHSCHCQSCSSSPAGGLTSDGTGTAALASRDHDEKFHNAVVDLGAPTLDDEDVLVPNRGVDTDAGLAITEFLKLTFCWLST